eukprot:gene5045-7042_t
MSTLGFELEWFDAISQINHTIFLKYFLDDNTIELLENKSTFLKRIFCPEINLASLFIGNSVTIFGRLMMIKAYANTATTAYIGSRETRYGCVIRKKLMNSMGRVFVLAKNNKLRLGKVFTVGISIPFVDISQDITISLEEGDSFVEVIGFNVNNKSKFLNELSNLGGEGFIVTNKNIEGILSEVKSIRVPQNVSLCLLKPHVLQQDQVGELLSSIANNNFIIHGIFTIHCTVNMIEEIFDVYRDVLINYSSMIEQLCSGPLMAVMVSDEDFNSDTVTNFREFSGPTNPEIARTLYPKSLRAQFGVDIVRNGVHCTDLSDDGEMECKFFFETLANL